MFFTFNLSVKNLPLQDNTRYQGPKLITVENSQGDGFLNYERSMSLALKNCMVPLHYSPSSLSLLALLWPLTSLSVARVLSTFPTD